MTAPVDVAPRGNAAFFSGLGSGFDDHRNIRGEFPSGVPVFTGYHPVPHEDFSPIEVEEKIVTGIHARKAAFNGTKPSECYKEAYVKCGELASVLSCNREFESGRLTDTPGLSQLLNDKAAVDLSVPPALQHSVS